MSFMEAMEYRSDLTHLRSSVPGEGALSPLPFVRLNPGLIHSCNASYNLHFYVYALIPFMEYDRLLDLC